MTGEGSYPFGVGPIPATGYGRRARQNAQSAHDMDKFTVTPFEQFDVPLGGQAIELQQLDFAAGGMGLLRVRIREGRRFTVFDLDPATARAWGDAMSRWAQTQPGGDRE